MRVLFISYSVLDLDMQLVEKEVKNVVLILISFSIQYILVNSEYWSYKLEVVSCKLILMVPIVTGKCTLSIPHPRKLAKSMISRNMIPPFTVQASELYVQQRYVLQDGF